MHHLSKPLTVLRLGLVALSLCLTLSSAYSQDAIFGKWKTIDDGTGEEKSIVEIFERDGAAYGRIIELLNPEPDDPDPVCDKCTDHRKDKRITGMEIITDLKKDGSEWAKGEILDPENGKVYKCKIWVDQGVLKVRGYIAFLYRTQTWLPAN